MTQLPDQQPSRQHVDGSLTHEQYQEWQADADRLEAEIKEKAIKAATPEQELDQDRER